MFAKMIIGYARREKFLLCVGILMLALAILLPLIFMQLSSSKQLVDIILKVAGFCSAAALSVFILILDRVVTHYSSIKAVRDYFGEYMSEVSATKDCSIVIHVGLDKLNNLAICNSCTMNKPVGKLEWQWISTVTITPGSRHGVIYFWHTKQTGNNRKPTGMMQVVFDEEPTKSKIVYLSGIDRDTNEDTDIIDSDLKSDERFYQIDYLGGHRCQLHTT